LCDGKRAAGLPDRLERADAASGSRMGAPEAGWRLTSNPHGPGHEEDGLEERWRFEKKDRRLSSQDGDPGRKMKTRDAKKTAIEAREPPGS
jgi:hypothetical protein